MSAFTSHSLPKALKPLSEITVLGIETSCDETSAAIVTAGKTIRANVIASQADLHARYGGVVPEVASRKHVERMLPVLQDALTEAGMTYAEIDAIAVTNRPGLMGALLVGVSAAKSLAYALDLPIVAVHHLEGHIYSNFLAAPDLVEAFPILVLIVSGGHTQIVRMDGHGQYTLLGKTRDDAAGEAFDKGARLLGLPYPGGPNVSKLAANGDTKRVSFPRSLLGDVPEYSPDFSFSGVKTALRNFLIRDKGQTPLQDVAASYEAAIVETLTEKLRRAAVETGIKTLCVAGGVAANQRLQATLQAMGAKHGYRVVIPAPVLCTDNAAMIAAAGYYRLQTNAPDSLAFDTLASSALIPAK